MPNNFAVLDQHDFTAGELDPQAKRGNDDPLVKAGARQLLNARILNTKGAANRPGRSVVASRAAQPRDEDVLMAPGVTYRLSFTNATLKIYDSTGTQVFTQAGRAWSGATLSQIVYAVYLNQVFITFPGVVPQVLTWDGSVSWSSASYAELVGPGGQKRTPFYRIARKGIQMSSSATTGVVNVTLDANYFTASHVGTRVRYIDRQILLTAFGSPTAMTGTVIEPLPGSQFVTFGIDPTGIFNLGDIVLGTVSGAQGYVVTLDAAGMRIGVQLMSAAASGIQSPATVQDAFGRDNVTQVGSFGFVATDRVVGGGGAIAATAVSAIGTPNLVPFWDEEVMNSFHGWPASCFADQSRVGFCNFPAVPAGISWSALGGPFDLYPDAFPSSAIFELAPGKARVQHVVPGPESAEFVFCDNAIHYIPISQAIPLKPGSVAFQRVGTGGAAAVQPRAIGDVILYVDQGLSQIHSIITVGAYNRPFDSKPLTDLHAHLFNNIQAIALPSSVTQFPERYAYVVNGDGTVAVGKYTLDDNGKLAGKIGWLPWNGFGLAKWVSALNDIVLFATAYTQGAVTAYMLEQLDATQYLDASLPINAIPAALTPPGGKGPLWWLPLATVDLMDGTFPLGPHATDANGFIVKNQPGEDLTSATLRAGFTWTMIVEPFLPPVAGGQDGGQRMKKRRCTRFEPYVANSSGFAVRQIYTGQQGRNLPAPGTYMGGRRIPAYNQDDDATKAPPARERAYTTRPRGRAHDPRVALVKDTPGPLIVVEISARVST